MIKNKKKTIIVIEDEPPTRRGIVRTLEIYGFNAIGKENIADNVELLKSYKNEVSVVIADMALDKFTDHKQYGTDITGIDLALGLLKEQPIKRPESIVLSAIAFNFNHYKKAIKAGASSYLLKGNPSDITKLIPLTQALSLKYAFQPNSNDSEILALIDRINNERELLSNFCENKLIPELDLCIGKGTYILLFQNKTAKDTNVSIHSNLSDIPLKNEFDYLRLHKQIFNPFVSFSEYFDLIPHNSAEKLRNFTFLKLVETNDFAIALGIPVEFPVIDTVREYDGFSSEYISKALTEFSKPSLENFCEKMVLNWRREQRARLEKLKTFVDWSESFNRGIKKYLPAETPKTLEVANRHFEELERFSYQIEEYQGELKALREYKELNQTDSKQSTIWLSEVVRKIETDYIRRGYAEEISFVLGNDCLIPVEQKFFSKALRELVKWAFDRRNKVIEGSKQVVHIDHDLRGDCLDIIVRENSKKLSKSHRLNYLFETMTSPNLAQLIIEIACQGNLIDATDESDSEIGHTFRIELRNLK
jgi:CheY-like chemotaxis protein